MWAATVIEISMKNDTAEVVVLYEDQNNNRFTQVISTPTPQGTGWIEGQLANKIKQLNALSNYVVTLQGGDLAQKNYTVDSQTGDTIATEIV